MALIDKASLLMVPSTYEAGKLYNVLPSGNRAPDSTDQNSGYDQTRADFDFDRGSNTAATRVNSDGLIEKYRENTAEHSNTFNQWSNKTRISFTSGQEDKDGGTDAWLAECTADGQSYFYDTPTTNTGIRTRSVYAKAGTASSITFLWDSFNQNEFATFNLISGTFTNAGCLADMEDVGNGWYRCITTITDASNTYAMLLSLSGKTGNSVTDGDNVYIMYAQQEAGLIATDYLSSTDVTGKAGVLVDLPRINYDANGENGSLLLEPSRQQLFQFSEYFGDSSWTKSSGVVITDNASISPEGLKNAYRIQIPSASGNSLMAQLVAHTSGVKMTISAYMKSNTGNDESFQLFGDYGTPTGKSGTLTATSEWKRFTFTFTPTATGDRNAGLINVANTAADILVYGFQAESNATYASSYIPNHGTSGGVTRAADSCSVTGVSDVIGQTEGTMFVEAETLENGADCRITISDNTINNRVSIEWDANADTIKGFIGVGGNLATTSYDQTNRNKIAIVYNSTDARLFINGTKVITDTSVPSLSGMDRIEFANFGAAVNTFFGKVYKMYVSEEKLTDAEAITLTTL